MIKVFSCKRDTTACNAYRILQPLVKLHEKGLAEVMLIEEYQLGMDKAIEGVLWADLLVFHRPANEDWFKFIKTMQKYGKIFVSDYDDNPFNTSPMNPFYGNIGVEEVEYAWPDGRKEWLWKDGQVSKTGKKIFDIERNINTRETFKLNFKKSDLVTCTTPELRDAFLKINPNVAILPNLIATEFFPAIPDMGKGEIRIGWQGGSSHYEDLFFVKPVIKAILEKHKNVKFVFYGDMRFQPLFDDCVQEQIEWHHWTSHDVYPYKLTLMNMDIGLCPLVDNEFNRTKSAIKWMEYSMVGMATIAANIPPYSSVIKNGETGLLCGEDHKEWIDALDNLILNRGKRHAMACLAKQDVLENHNLESKIHLWADTYENILHPKATVLK
jgi:hypothetical protein